MKNISSSVSPLDTCNACDLEVKTPNKMGYCDSCLSSVSPAGHTPTPWTENCGDINDANGKRVYRCEVYGLTMGEAEALSLKVVHGVNNHDALLAAAKLALRVFDDPELGTTICREELKAAIAAAEGK